MEYQRLSAKYLKVRESQYKSEGAASLQSNQIKSTATTGQQDVAALRPSGATSLLLDRSNLHDAHTLPTNRLPETNSISNG